MGICLGRHSGRQYSPSLQHREQLVLAVCPLDGPRSILEKLNVSFVFELSIFGRKIVEGCSWDWARGFSAQTKNSDPGCASASCDQHSATSADFTQVPPSRRRRPRASGHVTTG